MGSRFSANDVKREAAAAGFDLCGIAPVGALSELRFLREWLDRGYAGEMQYMHRSAERRADVRAVMPAARSVICLGTIYNASRPYSTEYASPTTAAIARYAWGDDYHVIIEQRMAALLERLRGLVPVPFEGRAYVDTGPVQERVYAQHAGLGWIGKNTCLINADRGSWLFLSAIVCSLPLEPDQPALDQCGSCMLCIEACPTGALVDDHVLDATKCLSYLTIELKGRIPAAFRDALGAHAYGCDICQDVCPWNLQPSTATTDDPVWQPRRGLDAPALLDLWRARDAELRGMLKGSAMKRAGVRRLRRNLATAIGNSGAPDAVDALLQRHEPTCDDPLVAEHVQWAVDKLNE